MGIILYVVGIKGSVESDEKNEVNLNYTICPDSDASSLGIEINVEDIPKDIKVIRFVSNRC